MTPADFPDAGALVKARYNLEQFSCRIGRRSDGGRKKANPRLG